jgi:DNA-binding CsgD family transcriptional regulator
MTLPPIMHPGQTRRDAEGSLYSMSFGLPASVPALPPLITRLGSGVVGRELVAPIAVVATLVLVDLTSMAFTGGGVFLLLLLPVILSLLLGGRRSALVALVLGAGGALLLVPIRGHPWLTDPIDLALVALYVGVGAGIVAATGANAGGRPPVDPGSGAGRRRTRRARPVESLTARELDVLRLAAKGHSVEQIGRQLYLSRNTVKSHLAHAYGKLGAHNRTQALVAGLGAGLLDPGALHEAD